MTFKHTCQAVLLLAFGLVGAAAADVDSVVIPGVTNAVRLRLYTEASTNAVHSFNGFALELNDRTLLPGPTGTAGSRPSLLVNGQGPDLQATNRARIVEEAQGDGWRFLRTDLTAAYREQLLEYHRDLLFVAPDLFIIRDHAVARHPSRFQTFLQVPEGTILDPIWKDLRFESTNGGFRLHAPSSGRELRGWTKFDTTAGRPITLELAPPNVAMTNLDLIQVVAGWKAGEKKDYAYKLLESNTAIGARIHRDGYPTIVAFRLDPAESHPSLAGFGFTGSVAVDVFRPRPRAVRK